MADGRDHIESTWAIVTEMADKADELRAGMSDAQVQEFNMYLESAQKWGALCRRKVWLRGQEGTGKAQRILDTAESLQETLSDPDQMSDMIDYAGDLGAQLESLGRIISSKSQILT